MKYLLQHKKTFAYIGFAVCLGFLFVVAPEFGFAQTVANPEDVDLVRCGGEGEDMCTVTDFFDLLGRVMRWGFRLGVALATLMFAYAGLLLMSSFGKPAQISKAKSIFLRAAIGIIIMFVSYSAIWFLVTSLRVEQGFYQFF